MLAVFNKEIKIAFPELQIFLLNFFYKNFLQKNTLK